MQNGRVVGVWKPALQDHPSPHDCHVISLATQKQPVVWVGKTFKTITVQSFLYLLINGYKITLKCYQGEASKPVNCLS